MPIVGIDLRRQRLAHAHISAPQTILSLMVRHRVPSLLIRVAHESCGHVLGSYRTTMHISIALYSSSLATLKIILLTCICNLIGRGRSASDLGKNVRKSVRHHPFQAAVLRTGLGG